jgi:hypothetical protein
MGHMAAIFLLVTLGWAAAEPSVAFGSIGDGQHFEASSLPTSLEFSADAVDVSSCAVVFDGESSPFDCRFASLLIFAPGKHAVLLLGLSHDGAVLANASVNIFIILFVKPFVYLLQAQTDDILSSPLLQQIAHDDADVHVLVWGRPSSHPSVLYLPNSSWAEGRNALFRRAYDPFRSYRYYVLLDDDVNLVHVNDFGRNARSPWRTFEAALLHFAPAIAVPFHTWHDINPAAEVQALYNFDPIVTAFHRDVAEFYLPYVTRFDAESWYYANVVTVTLAALFHNDNRLQINAVESRNALNRPYPKGDSFATAAAWILPAVLNPARFELFDPLFPTKNVRAVAKRKEGTYAIYVDEVNRCHPYFVERVEGSILRPEGGQCQFYDLGAAAGMLSVSVMQRVVYLEERVRHLEAMLRSVLEK